MSTSREQTVKLDATHQPLPHEKELTVGPKEGDRIGPHVSAVNVTGSGDLKEGEGGAGDLRDKK